MRHESRFLGAEPARDWRAIMAQDIAALLRAHNAGGNEGKPRTAIEAL
jgi:hypothetical protein